MTLTPSVNITVLSPTTPAATGASTSFSTRSARTRSSRNTDWQVRPGDSRLVPPPLSLNLSYLLTAYAPNDPLTGNATSHAMLGEAMRVLHEHPVVPLEYLVTGLAGAHEEIRIVASTLDLDAMSRIWATFTEPYRASTPTRSPSSNSTPPPRAADRSPPASAASACQTSKPRSTRPS